MKRLSYPRVHNLRRLADELAALPALASTVDPIRGRVARFMVSGGGDTLSIDVPDEIDAQTIDAIVAAHDPTPDPPPPPPSEPIERLKRMVAPRVITGSRSTQRDAILASLLRACEDAGFILDQTRA